MERKDLLKIIRDYLGKYYFYRKVNENLQELQENGFSFDEIKSVLDYWYGVKKNDPAKSGGGIRILLYIRDEAKEYWEEQAKRERMLAAIPDHYEPPQVEKIVVQKMPIKRPTRVRLFELP